MTYKQRIIKALTPKNTEEIKPLLFVQTLGNKKGKVKYRQVFPAAWNGKINWKNLIFGSNFWRSFLLFIIIVFLAFSYVRDIKVLREFQVTVTQNKFEWCAGIPVEDLRGKNEGKNTIALFNNGG